MHLDSDNTACGDEAVKIGEPRASDWLWNPPYAKVWWILIAVFWTTRGVISLFDLTGDLPVTPVDDYVVLILNPEIALPVLGFGFVREWFRYQYSVRHEYDAISFENYPWPRSGRNRQSSYLTDPTNPASPLNPTNPANLNKIY